MQIIVRNIIGFVVIWMFAFPVWSATSLLKSAEWPFLPPTLFLKGSVNAITVSEGLVFWAVGDTVAVIDKDDFTFFSTFQVGTSNAIQDILFDDVNDILYVAAGYDERDNRGGLQLYDISNPLIPTLIKVYDKSPDNPGSRKKNDSDDIGVDVPDIDARGLGLSGDTLFLADDNFGLRVIDIEDPANPYEVELAAPTEDRHSGYKQPDVNDSFAATGGYLNLSLYSFDDKIYAFVLDFYHGLKVFDVTDREVIDDPVLKDTRTYFWYGAVSLISDLYVNETGGRLTTFVTGGDATGSNYVVARLDVSFDEEMPISNFGRCITSGEARSVVAAGDYAYIADGSKGLSVVDISNVPEPGSVLTYNKVGSYTTESDFSYSVFLDGAVLYLATGESGLNRLSVALPNSPTFIDKLDSFISGDDVCVSGDYTFMLDRERGLRIFDTTEPSYPLLLSFLPLEGESIDLVVSGDYAYIAKRQGSVSVVNIADKQSPFLTTANLASTEPKKLFISGVRLHIADAVTGLKIVNIADPLYPSVIGTVATAGSAESVYVYDNKAYVAEGANGVEIFNISNPEAPTRITTIPANGSRDVFVLTKNSSVYVFVADGAAGVKIYDVSDDEPPLPDPVIVNVMDTDTDTPAPFTAVSVSVMDDLAYVGLGSDGILVLDVKNPLSPKELDHELCSSYTSDIVPQIIDNTHYITTAERYTGFRILYLHSSSDQGDDEAFVPTIDAGCFIETVSVTGRDLGWVKSIRDYLAI